MELVHRLFSAPISLSVCYFELLPQLGILLPYLLVSLHKRFQWAILLSHKQRETLVEWTRHRSLILLKPSPLVLNTLEGLLKESLQQGVIMVVRYPDVVYR